MDWYFPRTDGQEPQGYAYKYENVAENGKQAGKIRLDHGITYGTILVEVNDPYENHEHQADDQRIDTELRKTPFVELPDGKNEKRQQNKKVCKRIGGLDQGL
jgi:hypothetical protein